MKIYDTTKKVKVKFFPQEPNLARVYICGPTVYDDAHLGHARSAISFDILHRVLKANGYKVIVAKNFTDIDDKIINKSSQTGKSLKDITNYYIQRYQDDMSNLNILQNTIEPKATENIDEMIAMIENLLAKDVAYKLFDGIYFDTTKDKKYGNISNQKSDENSKARIKNNLEKRDQKDFVVWKFDKEIGFQAPFGHGRPGWHIECSAMIDKYLSNHSLPYAVDIHTGGVDLLFPHHENEATQTRVCFDQELAKYWMHNGFVTIDGEKMSKSLGNSFFLKDVLKSYDGEVIRFYMINTNYRSDFAFSEDDLISSKKRLDKLYRLKKRVYQAKISKDKLTEKFRQDILNDLNDDLNTAKALSTIDEFVAISNDKLDKNPKDKNLKTQTMSCIELLYDLLGIANQDPYSYFQFGIDTYTKTKIKQLIEKRDQYKKEKDFYNADKIRDELNSMNITISDTPAGVVWEKI